MANTQFDAPALAGATLAATLAVFIEPGPYDWFSGIIGITLMLIIVAYEQQRQRTKLQSAALGAVSAFVLLLIAGLIFELILGGGSLYGIPTPSGSESRVPTSWLSITWIVFAVASYFADRIFNHD